MKFTRTQARVLFALTLAYTCAYVCRTHISMLLPSLIDAFSLTQAQGGLIATMFAIVYASGQLFVGLIVDRVNPRAFILSGLALSSAANLGCSLAPSYEWILALWTVNAVGQSMLWTPIVRVMAITFDGKARERASFIMSITMVIGYVAAWLLAGLLTSHAGWRQAFAAPAAVTLAGGLAAYAMLHDSKVPPEPRRSKQQGKAETGLAGIIFSTGLLLVLASSAFNGFMRDSIMNWAPTILMETQGLALDGVLGVALIIPIVNFFGILFGRQCYRWSHMNARRCVALMLLLGGATSFVLFLFGSANIVLCAMLLSLTAATAYGINPVITTLLPLEYDRLRRVGTVAGMVDASIYLGSGLAGIAAGAVAENAGWSAVFLLWCAAGIAGAAIMLLSARERYRSNL